MSQRFCPSHSCTTSVTTCTLIAPATGRVSSVPTPPSSYFISLPMARFAASLRQRRLRAPQQPQSRALQQRRRLLLLRLPSRPALTPRHRRRPDQPKFPRLGRPISPRIPPLGRPTAPTTVFLLSPMRRTRSRRCQLTWQARQPLQLPRLLLLRPLRVLPARPLVEHHLRQSRIRLHPLPFVRPSRRCSWRWCRRASKTRLPRLRLLPSRGLALWQPSHSRQRIVDLGTSVGIASNCYASSTPSCAFSRLRRPTRSV